MMLNKDKPEKRENTSNQKHFHLSFQKEFYTRYEYVKIKIWLTAGVLLHFLYLIIYLTIFWNYWNSLGAYHDRLRLNIEIQLLTITYYKNWKISVHKAYY